MAKSFEFEESTEWVITHDLYSRSPIVECFVEYKGVLQKAIPLEVIPDSLTQVTVRWTRPFKGKARLA